VEAQEICSEALQNYGIRQCVSELANKTGLANFMAFPLIIIISAIIQIIQELVSVIEFTGVFFSGYLATSLQNRYLKLSAVITISNEYKYLDSHHSPLFSPQKVLALQSPNAVVR
jgi:hypothetical protein